MLDYKILDKKPSIKSYDGVVYKDLLVKTFNELTGFYVTPIYVNEYYVARPDLISFALYGDDKYADVLCKVNGISNPFEINKGDIILAPNEEYLNDCVYSKDNESGLIKDSKNETIHKRDANNYQKRKNEKRTPNEQVIGDSNFIIDKSLGIVIY